jgi:XapX domain-containing protein
MVKIAIGIVLGICIGIGCRVFGIPLPGPPAILGAVLAVAMATGYTVTDKVLASRAGAGLAQSGHAAETPAPAAETVELERRP